VVRRKEEGVKKISWTPNRRKNALFNNDIRVKAEFALDSVEMGEGGTGGLHKRGAG